LWQRPPVKEHFEDEPQAEELHEIMQSNTKKGKRMNLNELINKLKLVRCMAGDGQVLNEAETMLRQQQAEMDIVIKLLCGEQISDDLMVHWNPLHSTLKSKLLKA